MGLFSTLKNTVGHVVDFRVDRWTNLEWNKNALTYFWKQGRALVRIEKEQHAETFDQAIRRLGMTTEQVEHRIQFFRYTSLLFVFSSALLFAYTYYIMTLGNWMGMCVGAALTLFALMHAFRFHFWHFQLSQQKLDCSLTDWYKHSVSQRRLK